LEVAREKVVVLMANGHPLAAKPELTLRDVSAAPIVMGTDQQWDHYRDIILDALAAKGYHASIAMEAPTLFGILGLVGAGIGITLAPEVMCGFCPAGIVARPVADADQTITTLAAWRRPADKKVRDFIASLQSTLNDATTG